VRRNTRIPEDFTLTPDLTEYVEKTIPDAEPSSMFEKFKDQAIAKAWEYADWARAKDSGHFAAGQYPRRAGANGVVNWR
jgi:hypothetical protein